jgi:hypothetical protein
MVLPETAHASFQKAGHYLGVEPVIVPVDPVSFRADVAAVREAISDRTVLLVGSAVSYAASGRVGQRDGCDPVLHVGAEEVHGRRVCHLGMRAGAAAG